MRVPSVLGLLAICAVLACGPQLARQVENDTSGPAPRTDASAAYDPATRTVVFFGGTDRSGPLAETWTWDGSEWRRQHPATSPSPRQDAILAFDPSSNRLILFGGVTCGRFQPTDLIGCDDTHVLSDTWAWDGTTWSLVNTTQSPKVDHFAGDRINGATDEAHGRIIVVAHAHGDRDDRVQTWSFTEGDWHLLTPAHVPHLWDFSGPQFDAGTGRLLLLQGPIPHFDCGTVTCTNDFQEGMWTWDGSDWRTLPSNIPPDRGALLRTAHGLLLFGDGGLYTWNGSGWNAGAPLPWGDTLRDGWTGAYDAPRKTLVIYGGQAFGSNHLFGDLLGWDGRDWKTLTAPPRSPSSSPLSACAMGSEPPGVFSVGAKGASVSLAEPLTGPCHIKAAVEFALLGSSGEMLRVPGNPSTVSLDRDLSYDGGTIQVSFQVSGACALPPTTTARLSVGEWRQSSPGGGGFCEGSPPPIAITSSVETIKN